MTRARRPLAPIAVLAGLLALPACHPLDDETARFLNEPTERHAIGLAKQATSLHVEIGPDRPGLSENQRIDIASFLQGYREQGVSRLRISLPTSVRGRLVAGQSAREVRDLALELGLPRDRIADGRHGVHPGEPAAVILSFTRPVAMAPVCGDWSADLGRDHERVRYPQFGCATQRNLALNVANARDLVEPQPETPASGEQRFVSWTKYVGTHGTGGEAASPDAKPAQKPPQNPAPPAPSPQ